MQVICSDSKKSNSCLWIGRGVLRMAAMLITLNMVMVS